MLRSVLFYLSVTSGLHLYVGRGNPHGILHIPLLAGQGGHADSRGTGLWKSV